MASVESSFDQLYESLVGVVLWEAVKMLDDWALAEDVAQEAFLSYHRKLQAGETVAHPRSFVLKTAYYLALDRRDRPSRRASEAPADPRPAGRDPLGTPDAAPADDRLDAGPSSDAWDGLVYWGRRALDAILHNAPAVQRERLRALLDSGSRSEALRRLAGRGHRWSKTAVSMTLSRYSSKLDLCFAELLEAGPKTEDELKHWSLLEELSRRVPSTGRRDGRQRGLLTWVLRHVNRMPVEDRHNLVFRIFY